MHTNGIHHVTAISGDPRENVDFYTDVLGLRLVKKTVNFDDPETYHLYYGDDVGRPGTILTFFPFDGASPGRQGRGQVTATTFIVPESAVAYWIDRLEENDVAVESGDERFGSEVVRFWDHDGQPLELVARETGADVSPWKEASIPSDRAIRGIHGVTIQSTDPDATGSVLETLGYERVGEEDGRRRYRTTGDLAADVDVLTDDGPAGRMGNGTVHHVAFRTADDEEQLAWRERLADEGLLVTDVKDRRYFRSIYFREPGGGLFEIATDPPGFTRDETTGELGSGLKLPPWLEADRDRIERNLPPVGGGR